MGVKWLSLDDKAAKTLDEVNAAAMQAQIALASAQELIANLNRTVERVDVIVAKLAAVLK